MTETTALNEHDGNDASADQWQARWRAHPFLAFALRLAILLAPVGVAVLATSVLTDLVRRPATGWALVGWLALVMGVPTLILLVVGRILRHALPLAALLSLSLVFPDRAPRRFSLALRAGSTRHLEARLAEARQDGAGDDPGNAARRILELLGALGDHDRLTRGHCERVRAFNDLLADEMGLPPADRDRLRWAALLHDIGKLRVPRRILTKATKPDATEWEQLRRHPIEGARLTTGLSQWLGPWANSIEQHHERWDGAGYPNGLAGTEICLGARIVAVADTYEVMTARRPYQRPVSPDAARKELARCAGTQFDPAVVRAFLNISIGDLRRVLGPLSWLAELPLLAGVPRLEGVAVAAGRTAATLGVGTIIAAGVASAPPSSRPAALASAAADGADSSAYGGTTPGSPTPPGDRATTPPGDRATTPPGSGPGLVPKPAPNLPAAATPVVAGPGIDFGPPSSGVAPTIYPPALSGPAVQPPVSPPAVPDVTTLPALPVAPTTTLPGVVPPLSAPPAPSTTLPAAPPAPPTPPTTAPPSGGLLGGLLNLIGRTLRN